MNKKVIALAVAGALAAPVSALAQTTIYGVFNVEYGFYSPGNNAANQAQNNADSFSSGASRIGLRGEEKLGSGMSSWYQCESDIRFLDEGTQQQGSWCDRNSAVGLKGGFGNVFFGVWDSPLKSASGVSRITNEGGWLGTQGVLLTDFSNRNRQTINYGTPNMGGFSANLQVSNTKAAVDTVDTNSAVKGRIMAVGGQYATGPLAIVAALEQRKKITATLSGSGNDAKDEAWLIGATYRFGPFKVGLTYDNIKLDDGVDTAERKAYGVAGTYTTGSHLITLGYTKADDVDVTAGLTPVAGGSQIVASYNYLLSKRTNIGIGYSKVDNDSADAGGISGVYNLDNRNPICDGCSSSVISLNLTTNF